MFDELKKAIGLGKASGIQDILNKKKLGSESFNLDNILSKSPSGIADKISLDPTESVGADSMLDKFNLTSKPLEFDKLGSLGEMKDEAESTIKKQKIGKALMSAADKFKEGAVPASLSATINPIGMGDLMPKNPIQDPISGEMSKLLDPAAGPSFGVPQTPSPMGQSQDYNELIGRLLKKKSL